MLSIYAAVIEPISPQNILCTYSASFLVHSISLRVNNDFSVIFKRKQCA